MEFRNLSPVDQQAVRHEIAQAAGMTRREYDTEVRYGTGEPPEVMDEWATWFVDGPKAVR